jgi:hypothetical protein
MPYKVSYHQILHDGKIRKNVTKITYKTKAEALKYARQLNASNSYKNARVRKA